MKNKTENNNGEISDKVSNRIGNEVLFTEEIKVNYFNSNCSKSKYPGDNNVDHKYEIGKKVGNKKLWFDNLKVSK